jgi:hypothetical protein
LTTISQKTKRVRFFKSKSALALPVTYLILFVSTMLLISVTYVFAVQQVNNQKQSFDVLTAKQDMTSLDDQVLSVVSQPGSAATLDFRDSGGQLNVEPSSNNLTLTVTDGSEINAVIFNSSTGQVVYNLPAFTTADMDFYLEGDSSTITNQSGVSLSQLYIASGLQGPQVQLGYRPAVTYAPAGVENDQAVTDIRIYIVNLNSSIPFALQGELPLQISCVSTQLTTETFQTSQPGNLTVTSQLNGDVGSVLVPISSTQAGSTINVEIVISNITIEEGIA